MASTATRPAARRRNAAQLEDLLARWAKVIEDIEELEADTPADVFDDASEARGGLRAGVKSILDIQSRLAWQLARGLVPALRCRN